GAPQVGRSSLNPSHTNPRDRANLNNGSADSGCLKAYFTTSGSDPASLINAEKARNSPPLLNVPVFRSPPMRTGVAEEPFCEDDEIPSRIERNCFALQVGVLRTSRCVPATINRREAHSNSTINAARSPYLFSE